MAQKMPPVRSPWTKDDIRQLSAYSNARTPVVEAAKAMNRTEAAVRQKAKTIDIGRRANSTPTGWNSYLLPIVVLKSEPRYPWTLGSHGLPGPVHDIVATRAPVHHIDDSAAILMFLMAQRYTVGGLTARAVKA